MKMYLNILVICLLVMVVSADETVIEDVSVTYQALTDARLAKMDGILHIQALQIQEGNMRIQNLEGMLKDHKSEIRKQNLQLQIQNEHIQNIENTMQNYKNEIIKLEDKLSGLELREEKSERRLSDLLNIITNIKLDKHKSLVQDLNVDISNTSEESNGENNNMSPDNEKKSKGRRLLIPNGTSAPPIKVTAFYAQLSQTERAPSLHRTLIFDTVKTNQNGAYSKFSGIFTAPVSGVYCFLYTTRVACHSSTLRSSFEIVRNNEVEGSIYTSDDGCFSQVTMTGSAVVHVNQGDEVYIRIHGTYTGDFIILSDTNGKSSFAGWLIGKDE